MKLHLLRCLGLGLAFFAFSANAEKRTYQFDNAHTDIGFKARYMMLARVSGNFTDFTGSIEYDKKNLSKSSVNVSIKSASITTDHQKRDGHLKSPDFFDVAKHPEITFKSTKAAKKDGKLWVTGDLTMRGKTKSVSFPFTLVGPVKDPYGGHRIGAEATLTINRTDWGVSWNKPIDKGGVLVSEKIEIELLVGAISK